MIQAAREVWVVAAGADKAGAVRLALSDSGPVQVPAAGARGRQRTLFLLDRGSAAKIPASLGRISSPDLDGRPRSGLVAHVVPHLLDRAEGADGTGVRR
nr:hypothetical protein GCM10020093_028920 [Planobispora longispora]